jgi:hypothetical protein
MAHNRKVLGFLTPENFQNIYHLKPPKAKCNEEYLDKLYIVNPKGHVLMKTWFQEEEDFKDRAYISKYNTTSIIPPVQYLTTMLSRLLREVDCMFFKSEWIPLAHGVMSVGIVFNWASILSANIIRALEKAIERPDAKGAPFYFFNFLLIKLTVKPISKIWKANSFKRIWLGTYLGNIFGIAEMLEILMYVNSLSRYQFPI